MIIDRVIAGNYGAFRDAALDGLQEGLNVVFGRNEAGKTTYTSLVRDVLYGFPATGKEKDRYAPADGGTRSGALVLADGSDAWRVDRTHTRVVADREAEVTELDGSRRRPDLVQELTHGVSSDMFAGVLGFGLDELTEAGGLSDERLRSALFTAGAGLGKVDLAKVREELLSDERDRVAGRKGGSAAADDAASALEKVESELADAERDRASLDEERRRLSELDDGLAQLEADRDAAEVRFGRLQTIRGTLATLRDQREKHAERIAEAQGRLERIDDDLGADAPDAAVLAAAADIESLRLGLEMFEHEMASGRRAETDAASAGTEASRLAAALGDGWTPQRCSAVPSGVELASKVNGFLERFRRASLKTEQDEARAAEARTEAEASREQATAALRQTGVAPEPEAAVEVRRRLDEVRSAGRAGAPAGGTVRWWPSVVTGLVAAAVAVASVVAREWIGLGVAALVGGLAVYLAITARRDAAAGTPGGTGAAPGSESSLESALRALEEADRAASKADAAEGTADEARAAEEALRGEWESFCRDEGLPDGVDDPQIMAGLLDACGRVAQKVAEEVAATERAEAARSAVDAYVARLRGLDVAEALVEDGSPERAVQLVGELSRRLAAARETEAERRDLAKERAAVSSELERARGEDAAHAAEETASLAQVEDVLREAGLPTSLVDAGVDVIVERAGETAAQARDAHANAVAEREGLAVELRQAERAEHTEALRQERELRRRELSEAVERYVVYRLAQRLLDEAQRRYEKERQPAVVQRAGELFAGITDGLYTGVVARVGEEGIQVIQADGAPKPADKLSRGAKEQLYLAVRLAFIEELAETGCGLPLIIDDAMGNFDDERMANVAVALAQVAESRQVIVFTCHDSTVAAFEAAAPDCNLVTLERR